MGTSSFIVSHARPHAKIRRVLVVVLSTTSGGAAPVPDGRKTCHQPRARDSNTVKPTVYGEVLTSYEVVSRLEEEE